MKSILFVCKDISPAKMVSSIVLELSGTSVHIQSEGLATSFLEKQGYERSAIVALSDTHSARLRSYLRRNQIDCVVVGLSTHSSIETTIEEKYAKAAKTFGIPVVFLEDIWGAHVRNTVAPDAVITIDAYAEKLLYDRYGLAVLTFLCGNPAVSEEAIHVSDKEREEIWDVRFPYQKDPKVFVFSESGRFAATEQIDLLAACVAKTNESVVIIPRFHPKNKEFHNGWKSHMAARGVVVRSVSSERVSTEGLALASDGLISGYSTMLASVAHSRGKSLSLMTPKVADHMEEETGLRVYPLAEQGIVPSISRPSSLVDAFARNNTELLKCVEPFDSCRAASAILSL